MTNTTLDARLSCAASFVRVGAVLADIGTDHGYLPIFLLSRGVIERAVLCDVNSGPLASARENVGAAGLLSRCEFVLTDGAAALDGRGITDYTVCGMGGELIADIIDRAPHLFDPAVRLILQPMTHADKLRKHLWNSGFSIVGERLVKEDKIYQIICAEYTSETVEHTELDAIFGKLNAKRGGDIFEEYAGYVREVFKTRRNGKSLSGADVSEEESIIREIDKLLDKGRKE